MTSAGVYKIMGELIGGYPIQSDDPNRIFKEDVMLDMRRLAECLEEHERYGMKLTKLRDEYRNLDDEYSQLQAEAASLDGQIASLGINEQLQKLKDLREKLDTLKQLESLEKDRYNDVSSQMRSSYEILQSRHRTLVSDLNGMEREFNSGIAHLRTLKETIDSVNTELHKYNLRASHRRENAENALMVMSLRNINAILRLVREGHEREFQESKDLLAKLEDELRMQELQAKQSDSEEIRHKKARYDAYLENLGEYENAVAVYNEIENVQRELHDAEDLARTKSVELESLSELSKTLRKDLERCQRMTNAAENHESLPGSMSSLQHHASEKCKELVEMVQDVCYRRAKYNRTLEDRYFLRNLVSGVLTFFSVATGAHFFISRMVFIQ